VTTAVREAPHHRNLTCYTDYGCRRPECVERRRQWQRDHRRKQREGQPVLLDAGPVRLHLKTLQDAGISINAIARTAGLDEWTLRNFLPATSGKRPRKHRVTPEVARKILAVTAESAAVGYVDGTGTRRRIQALAANGWPMRRVAEHLGLNPTYVGDLTRRTKQDRPVFAATADKVARAYEQLKNKKPTRHGIEARVAKRIRGLAASKRWAPSSYWDKHPGAIDDPHFESSYGVTRREIVAHDAGELMRFGGLDKEGAAERLGVSKSYIEHAFRDHPQYALETAA
jgi:hypothetical protein